MTRTNLSIKRYVRSVKLFVRSELKHDVEPSYISNEDGGYDLSEKRFGSSNFRNWKSNLHMNSTKVRLMYRKAALAKEREKMGILV